MRIAALFVLLATACASPEEAFVGRFPGIQTCAGRNVDTGEALVADPQEISVSIDRDADTGEAFIAGRCQVPLDVRSVESAAIVRVTCNTTTDDGTPITATYESGALSLRGDELRMNYSMVAVTPSGTFTLNYDFVGYRE